MKLLRERKREREREREREKKKKKKEKEKRVPQAVEELNKQTKNVERTWYIYPTEGT